MFYSIYILAICALFQLCQAHTVITYPGWRGDNLHTTGTVYDTNGLGSLTLDNGTIAYPYGMQWQYPCGGMPMSTNRTKWPIKGGAIAFQPGWFSGHHSAFMYFNLGLGNMPPNYTWIMTNGINLQGPTGAPYPGTFCLPQVPMPANLQVNVGDNATIQIIETALHGAALYNCVDITFADPEDVAEVNETNCFNSSQIKSNLVFTTDALQNSGLKPVAGTPLLSLLATVFIVYVAM